MQSFQPPFIAPSLCYALAVRDGSGVGRLVHNVVAGLFSFGDFINTKFNRYDKNINNMYRKNKSMGMV